MTTLAIEKRDSATKLSSLRGTGVMPAVYYGKKTPSTSIAVSLPEFIKAWKQAGESTVVTLKAKDESLDSLIHDVDLHPVTGIPRHADFYVFEKGQKIEVSVPLEFIGVSPAIKELGGTLVKVLYEIKVEAEPKNLPHSIAIDISSLVDFKSTIHAKDVKLPAGVELKEHSEEVVASVSEPKEEVEEVAAPVDLSTIEVQKKGKEAKEGEGEATEEAGAKPAK